MLLGCLCDGIATNSNWLRLLHLCSLYYVVLVFSPLYLMYELEMFELYFKSFLSFEYKTSVEFNLECFLFILPLLGIQNPKHGIC